MMDSFARMAYESLTLTPREQLMSTQGAVSTRSISRAHRGTAFQEEACRQHIMQTPAVCRKFQPAPLCNKQLAPQPRAAKHHIQLLCSLIHHHTGARAIHAEVFLSISTHDRRIQNPRNRVLSRQISIRQHIQFSPGEHHPRCIPKPTTGGQDSYKDSTKGQVVCQSHIFSLFILFLAIPISTVRLLSLLVQ